MKYDEFGTRMKQYEQLAEMRLEKKVPVAIRLDGKAFHTFTKGLEKPFDQIFSASMQGTMQALCEDIQGCVFGYTQSDEITLILIDYQNPESSAWFDYRVQKMASVAAGLATKYFNYFFQVLVSDKVGKNICESAEAAIEEISDEDIPLLGEDSEEIEALVSTVSTSFSPYINTLLEKSDEGASFDARCFNIPREEVCNLIYWRQTDAIRNSIQACGQATFSHKELHGKSCEEIKEMLKKDETPLDWDKDIPIYWQRGCACYKEDYIDIIEKTKDGFPNIIVRTRWKIDREMPILKGENREYVEKWV